MDSTTVSSSATKPARPFRLWLYLLIVFGMSWPFLFVNIFIPLTGDEAYWSSFAWAGAGMLMVTVATFIAGRWVFRDGFRSVGWRWGNTSSWIMAFGLPVLIWIVPAVLDLLVGARTFAPFRWNTVTQTLITITFASILGFGEEFGFRGYLLPRLWWMGPRRAALVNGLIWWAWHYPLFLIPLVRSMVTTEQNLPAGWTPLTTVLFLTLPHILRLICLGYIFSYVWVRSGSIAVASVFHGAWDAVRNLTFFWLVGSGFAGILPGVLDFPLPFLIELVLALFFVWRGRWVLPAETGACS